MPYNILLAEGIHSVAAERLKDQGFYVETMKSALSEQELIEATKKFHIIGIRSKTEITSSAFSQQNILQAIGCFCIGTNQVDLVSANQHGVPVFNAPYSNTRSVAELVIAEFISLSRQLFDRSQKAHIGEWVKTADGSNEVRGKNLGIVGYGHIGSQVSILAENLGMKVFYYDIVKKLPLGNAQSCTTLEELLKNSDFITIHVPESEQTKNLFTQSEFQKMKKGSYLINASRGTVVVIDDLVQALKSKHLAGCAIDVFPIEPSSNKEKFLTPLQGLENVILTPHIGGSTTEAQYAIGLEVAESFLRFIDRGSTLGAVNFPNIDIPLKANCERIINVHKNEPGVLGEINGIVSKTGANIISQALSTDQNIGYLVMDVEKADAKTLNLEIGKLKRSIRTKLLNL